MPTEISFDLICRNTTELHIREYMNSSNDKRVGYCKLNIRINHLKSAGYVTHHQFNI
jgi:hypothetical protein